MVPNGEEVEQERTLEQGIPYGIVVSAGTPTDSLLSERTERLRRAQETHTSTSEPVLGELIHILGMKFFSEKSRICSEVASHLSGVNYVPLYGVAIVTGGSSYGIDVKIDSRIFVSGPTADRDTERALDILEGIIASAVSYTHLRAHET